MTLEIAIVLGILFTSVLLFITDKVRMDVVALLVLSTLALTGLVTPVEVLSGFSNPAVITVWAMFILSSGLTKTGVANIIGRYVLGLAGQGEVRMIVVIMLTAGVLSAFMNNIGVAALLLPVVMDIARRTDRSPSRLLLPLAYGSLLGGLTTLIGTPPNLLASDALREWGLEPFGLFDYSPIGAFILCGGTLFVAFIGRYFLPKQDPKKTTSTHNLKEQYALHERSFIMRVVPDSVLVGKTLAQARLSSALGLTVFAIDRNNQTLFSPGPQLKLQANDRLMVSGRMDRLHELRGWRELVIKEEEFNPDIMASGDIKLAEFRLSENSPLVGQTLFQTDFRRKFGANVLAIRNDSKVQRTHLPGFLLHAGDCLLVQGHKDKLSILAEKTDFKEWRTVSTSDLVNIFRLPERIFEITIPKDSALSGEKLLDSRLGDAFGLNVLAIIRDSKSITMPEPDEKLASHDRLLIEGKEDSVEVLRGLQQLDIESKGPPDLMNLESQDIGLMEVTLSPRTTLVGQTLRQINFRHKYGLTILSIWREGEVYRSDLRDMELQFGDALLILGRWEKLQMLADNPDFLVLTETLQEAPKTKKMPLAIIIMLGVLLPVLFGVLPIAIAAVAGATMMVLTGCLKMEEAYRSIEWEAIFLIAGMLPLGIAMQQTGAASLLAEQVVAVGGEFGPWGVLISLYIITSLATTIIPTSALIVLMAPIVLKTATGLGLSPHSMMMAVALAASASFTSPISHPANILVMGPGGYRFNDYLKLGVPLAILVFLIVMIVLPVFWPLYP